MTPAAGDEVLLSRNGAIARVVLNRPEKRNALSASLIARLKSVLREVAADADVRVVAVMGGGKDFCSGADLSALHAMADASVQENLEDVDGLAELYLLIRTLRIPVVAVVRGRALA